MLRATGQNFLSVFSKVTVTLVFLHPIAQTTAKLSGYYYDNGYQQTVIDTSLGLLEKEVMQEEILHLLGRVATKILLRVFWEGPVKDLLKRGGPINTGSMIV